MILYVRQALHRDGVTCAQLVRTATHDDANLPAADATGQERGHLTLCTSSKDGSLKICSLEREVSGRSDVAVVFFVFFG